MPFSSDFKHSKLSRIKLDTAGGVLTDVSDAVDAVDFPEDLELVETTVFGDTSKRYMVGYADSKLTISGNWSRSQHNHWSALKTAFRDGTITSASFEYAPEGITGGCIKIYGEAVLTSYKKNSAVKDQVKFDSEWQCTGPVYETTY
jgi:hypothetical protein